MGNFIKTMVLSFVKGFKQGLKESKPEDLQGVLDRYQRELRESRDYLECNRRILTGTLFDKQSFLRINYHDNN